MSSLERGFPTRLAFWAAWFAWCCLSYYLAFVFITRHDEITANQAGVALLALTAANYVPGVLAVLKWTRPEDEQ